MDISPENKWSITQVIYQEILDEIYSHFETIKVRYMPIKGAYLLYSGLADKMQKRSISDIDLLICEEDKQKVFNFFESLSNIEVKTNFANNYRTTEAAFWYTLGEVRIIVELHTELNVTSRFYLPTEELFQRSIAKDQFVRVPSLEDSLLIFLCHLQTHITFEFKETNLEEIHLLSEQKGFSWTTFWAIAGNTGILPFHYFILRIYEKAYLTNVNSPKRFLYSDFLVILFNCNIYTFSPQWIKRLLFELPFVMNPWWLIKQKIGRGKKKHI